jgi:thiamine pyrophosphate-dependent acetolactate synthase large subunit-like protein
MGLLAYVGSRKPRNLFHFVIDNEAYASTGSQATVSRTVELAGVAAACGYAHALRAETRESLRQALRRLASLEGPVLIHVKVASGGQRAIARVSDRYTCPEIARRFAASRGR